MWTAQVFTIPERTKLLEAKVADLETKLKGKWPAQVRKMRIKTDASNSRFWSRCERNDDAGLELPRARLQLSRNPDDQAEVASRVAAPKVEGVNPPPPLLNLLNSQDLSTPLHRSIGFAQSLRVPYGFGGSGV